VRHEKLTPITSDSSGTSGHDNQPAAIVMVVIAITARCTGTSTSRDVAGWKSSAGRYGRSSRT
jgi:hypothetical protein